MDTTLKALTEYPDINFIDDYTLQLLEANMLAWFLEKREEVTKKTITLGEADDRRLMLKAAAYYIFHGYEMIDRAGKMNMLKYSIGDFLENLGAMKRTSRLDAAGSTATIRFSMDTARSSATGIPAGSRVSAGDGVYFATNEYAEIAIGETYADVRATCMTEGSAGNSYGIGEIRFMVDVVPFIDSVTNVTAAEGGRDIEDDDDLRTRIYLAPDSYTDAGSKGGYEYYAREFDTDIADVKATSPSPRIAEVRILLANGQIPGEEFLAALSEYMENSEIRKLTDSLTILAPTVENYNLQFTYWINESDRSRAEQIQNKVNDAYAAYILWQKSKIGIDINPDELIQMVKAAGAKRVSVVSPTYTVIDDESVAICQNTSVTYGGLEDD